MKKNLPAKLFAAYGAALCAGAHAQYTQSSVAIDPSVPGMKWSTAAWSDGLPDANTEASVSVSDGLNPFLLDGDASVANLTVSAGTNFVMDAASLTTTAADVGDLYLKDSASFELKNGATLEFAAGRGFRVGKDASFNVNASAVTGRILGEAADILGTVRFENASTWNTDQISANNYRIVLDNSTLNLTGGLQMWEGNDATHSRILTLQNGSTLEGNGNGANIAGDVNLLGASKIQNIIHFNIGRDGGSASGATTLTLRGTDAEAPASVNVTNTWINTQPGAEANLVLDGFSSYASGKIDVDKAFASGDASILFKNSGNTLAVSGDTLWGVKVADATQSGNWLISVAEGATGNTFQTVRLRFATSAAEGNAFATGADWSGTDNVMAISELKLSVSTAAESQAKAFLTVRDDATVTVNSHIDIGTNIDGKSGTASVTVKDGGVLAANSGIRVMQSVADGADSLTSFAVDNAAFSKTNGYITVGGTLDPAQWNNVLNNAKGGTAVFEVKNGGTVDISTSFRLNLSTEADSASVSKLVVDGSTFKTSGEIYMGAHTNTVAGGRAVIEVRGENALLESTNKGLFSGHNSTMNGGTREILLGGKNNSIIFGLEGVEAFNMSTSGSAIQTGGSFDVKIAGESNTFRVNSLNIGDANSTGGSNSFYMNGGSEAAKNTLLFGSGYTLTIRGSVAEGSEIRNSLTMAGNSVLTRIDDNTVNIGIGSASGLKGGVASFIVTGSGNRIDGEHLTIGNADATGGLALFRVEGYGNELNFRNSLKFEGGTGTTKDAVIGGKFEFVLTNDGLNADIAMLNIAKTGAGGMGGVSEFSGILEVDFSALTGAFDDGEFLIISAGNDWQSLFDTWAANSNNYKFNFRDAENDTANFEYRNGGLYVKYTSAVPEPSAWAALLGCAALCAALLRRRKNRAA